MRVYDINAIQAELRCVCGLQKTWLKVGQISTPCPICGAKIRAYYDGTEYTIKAEKFVDPDDITNIKQTVTYIQEVSK